MAFAIFNHRRLSEMIFININVFLLCLCCSTPLAGSFGTKFMSLVPCVPILLRAKRGGVGRTAESAARTENFGNIEH